MKTLFSMFFVLVFCQCIGITLNEINPYSVKDIEYVHECMIDGSYLSSYLDSTTYVSIDLYTPDTFVIKVKNSHETLNNICIIEGRYTMTNSEMDLSINLDNEKKELTYSSTDISTILKKLSFICSDKENGKYNSKLYLGSYLDLIILSPEDFKNFRKIDENDIKIIYENDQLFTNFPFFIKTHYKGYQDNSKQKMLTANTSLNENLFRSLTGKIPTFTRSNYKYDYCILNVEINNVGDIENIKLIRSALGGPGGLDESANRFIQDIDNKVFPYSQNDSLWYIVILEFDLRKYTVSLSEIIKSKLY